MLIVLTMDVYSNESCCSLWLIYKRRQSRKLEVSVDKPSGRTSIVETSMFVVGDGVVLRFCFRDECLCTNDSQSMSLRGYSADTLTFALTHWGRVTHICVSEPTSISSDNGLAPGRRQAIIWTNAGILLTGPLGTNMSEIVTEIQTFSLRKMRLKMSSAKRQPFCLGLNVLTHWGIWKFHHICEPFFCWRLNSLNET